MEVEKLKKKQGLSQKEDYLVDKINELVNYVNYLNDKVKTLEKTKAKKTIVYGGNREK